MNIFNQNRLKHIKQIGAFCGRSTGQYFYGISAPIFTIIKFHSVSQKSIIHHRYFCNTDNTVVS